MAPNVANLTLDDMVALALRGIPSALNGRGIEPGNCR
jgi:hypothetical protein